MKVLNLVSLEKVNCFDEISNNSPNDSSGMNVCKILAQ